jgi:hypothetical protein
VAAFLSLTVAALALAGAAIHFAVIRHHAEFVAIAIGFGVMGIAQSAVAVRMFVRPSRAARRMAVTVHATILTVWVLSRTTGLVVVPGAEDPSRVGLADLIATAFGVAVIICVGALNRLERRPARSQPIALQRGLAAAVGVVVLALAAPAIAAPHVHDHGHAHAPSHEGHHHGEHDH